MTTTRTRKVNRTAAEESQSLRALPNLFKSWLAVKRQVAAMKKLQDQGNAEIKALILKHGREDDKGSQYVDLQEEIDGVVVVKSQRTVKTGFNPEAFEEIARRKGIYDALTVTVREPNPEAIQAAYFSSRDADYKGPKLTKEELDRIYPQSVIYSLVMLDKAGHQVS